jgi:hypothetical protein
MKNTTIFMLLTLISSTASADDVCPEFANMVSAISENGASAQELGMEKAVAKQRKKGIYRGYDSSIRLEQPSASVSVKASQSFAFKPFSTKKQYRELVVGGTTNWGGSKDRKSTDNSIPLKFKKISDGCYRVTPGATLPKGQYAFSLASVGMGSSADVKGTNAGFGSSVQGQTWFGFTIK